VSGEGEAEAVVGAVHRVCCGVLELPGAICRYVHLWKPTGFVLDHLVLVHRASWNPGAICRYVHLWTLDPWFTRFPCVRSLVFRVCVHSFSVCAFTRFPCVRSLVFRVCVLELPGAICRYVHLWTLGPVAQVPRKFISDN
jgi:hypothetical protein